MVAINGPGDQLQQPQVIQGTSYWGDGLLHDRCHQERNNIGHSPIRKQDYTALVF